MENKKEATVHISSVGADEGQPLKTTANNITEQRNDEFFDAEIKKLQRLCDPHYLKTVSMSELYENVYISSPPIIDGILYPGMNLLVGASKIGKSFLSAQIAYHVSMGTPLWDFPVRQGTVLYLALEDDFSRLQRRLYRMFGAVATDNLHFAVAASSVGDGLNEQLQNFVSEHPDTVLIIIDTLQKIRKPGDEKYSYASDYEFIGSLKSFADSKGICIMVVHHTRKQQADDHYDREPMVSWALLMERSFSKRKPAHLMLQPLTSSVETSLTRECI